MTIGLTYTGTEAKHQYYVDWLRQDEEVKVITLSAEPAINNGHIRQCDAVVFSGGIDTHPRYYGSSQLLYPNQPPVFNERRDEFEKQLFNDAQSQELPVLGVCRGLQLINSLLGGSLVQDLGEKNSIHKAVVTEEGVQFDKSHGLHISRGTLMEKIAGRTRVAINSAHHQCVDLVAPSLKATAFSDDDVIEAMEWLDEKDKPFLLCVQWHPERMFEFGLQQTAASAGVLKAFLDAVHSKIAYS